jgi:hypothetical protein
VAEIAPSTGNANSLPLFIMVRLLRVPYAKQGLMAETPDRTEELIFSCYAKLIPGAR